jgi:hypothetical protein
MRRKMSPVRKSGLVAGLAALVIAAGLAAVTGHAASAATIRAAAPGAPAVTTTNIYNTNSGRCLGIDSAGDAGIWNCTDAGGKSDQTWHWGAKWTGSSPYGEAYYQLINGHGQCLGVAGGSTANGAKIVGFRCIASHKDQYWQYNSVWGGCECGDGPVLANLQTPLNGLSLGGKVIGVKNGGKANGTQLVLWTNYTQTGPFHPDQAWYMAAI